MPNAALLRTVLAWLLLTPAAAAAEPWAARIDATNAERVRRGGADAIGGLGDWALGDGVVCAVVSDPTHESDFSTTGGSLVDLGRCDRADDQFLLHDALRNLSPSRIFPAASVRAEQDAARASLVVRGAAEGLTIETRYALDAARPGRLRVESRVVREAEGEALFGLGAAFVNAYTLRPFVTSLASPGRSRGFVGPAFVGKGAGAIAEAAVAADTLVLVGDASLRPSVSYGARLRSAERVGAAGERIALPVFVVADDLASIFAVFARPFWLGGETSLGWAQLLETRLMDLDPGESIEVAMELVVGERADVASALDQLLDGGVALAGRVDDPAARVHVDAADGAPMTEIAPDADGRFAARVAPGAAVLRVVAPGGRSVTRAIEVGPAGIDVGAIAVGTPARVILPRGHAMRLVFVGVGGTPDPVFGDDLLGFAVLGKEVERTLETRDVALSGTASDPAEVVVPPGRYRVYATRGLEYGVTETEIEAKPGAAIALAIEPPARAIETPGWIGADFHVHGARSLDSGLGDVARLSSWAAEGGEVLVSTDHEAVTDFGPTARAMGLASQMATVTGLEVTSEARTPVAPHTIGHANAFPYRADPLAYRDGAPANEGRRWRDVLPALRAVPGERVVQLNHARYPGGAQHPRSFFTHLGFVGEPYDPALPLDAWPNRVLTERDPTTGARDLDFDAIELLNGQRADAYEALRDDWISLLRQGVVLTGTANSDSHNLKQIVGMPRTYVALADDSIAGFDEAALVAAVRGQRCSGTSGPFVEATLGGAGIGQRFTGRAGTLALHIAAAPWVPVGEWRVLVNGTPHEQRAIRGPGAWEIPLRFDADAFVTVEVRGAAGGAYAAVLPGFTPLAFTNPIFVDADGDGTWTPPGLP